MSEYEDAEEIDERKYAEFLGSIGVAQTIPDGFPDEEIDLLHKKWEESSGWTLKREPAMWSKLVSYLINELNFSDDEWRIYIGIARERSDVLGLDAWVYLRIRNQSQKNKYQKLEHLNRENLETAVIIDFEGLMDEDPSMAGILCDGEFRQVCFNPTLKDAAIEKGLEYSSLESFLDELLTKCMDEKRLVIGYSSREYNVFCEVLPSRVEEVTSVYLNALATKWFSNRYRIEMNTLRSKKKKSKYMYDRKVGLKDFLDMEVVVYPLPSWVKGVGPAKAIRRLEKAITNAGDYASVTPRTKRSWTMMLKYNRIDIEGLSYLLNWILSES